MNNQQKGTILTLLKIDESNRNYTNNYWFSYKDFLAQRMILQISHVNILKGNKNTLL